MSDSKRYLRPEVTTRIRRLELKARRVVEGFLSGMHRSPYFGQSIEFLQHRQYTRGDEIRHIDWKVYARQDRLHIKQYEEETNLRLTLLVDRSASMAYGDGESNKFDYSASIAACLGYLALRQKDATGLYTFDTALRATVPAKSNHQQLSRILSMLESVGSDGRTDLTAVAKQVAQEIPRRGLVLIISDLLGVDNLMEGLRVLRQRGHDAGLVNAGAQHGLAGAGARVQRGDPAGADTRVRDLPERREARRPALHHTRGRPERRGPARGRAAR